MKFKETIIGIITILRLLPSPFLARLVSTQIEVFIKVYKVHGV